MPAHNGEPSVKWPLKKLIKILKDKEKEASEAADRSANRQDIASMHYSEGVEESMKWVRTQIKTLNAQSKREGKM